MGVIFQQAPLWPPRLGVRVTADPEPVALPTKAQLGQVCASTFFPQPNHRHRNKIKKRAQGWLKTKEHNKSLFTLLTLKKREREKSVARTGNPRKALKAKPHKFKTHLTLLTTILKGKQLTLRMVIVSRVFHPSNGTNRPVSQQKSQKSKFKDPFFQNSVFLANRFDKPGNIFPPDSFQPHSVLPTFFPSFQNQAFSGKLTGLFWHHCCVKGSRRTQQVSPNPSANGAP